MHIIGNYLCFECAKPEKILYEIPDCRCQQGFIGVPFTLRNAYILKQLGYNPPSPIVQADLPGRFSPYQHQMETMQFWTLNKRGYDLSDMGAGKTLAALWACEYLKSIGLIRKVLIVSPLSTLESVWGSTIFLDFPHRTYTILHSTGRKGKSAVSVRKSLLDKPYDYYIINHHGVALLQEELVSRDDIDLIIFDEAAIYRNKETDLWKAAKNILTQDKWGWALTGSPTPQAPTDAYGIVKLITPERYQGSFARLRDSVMYKATMYKWEPRPGAEEFIATLLAPSIRHKLDDCVDLPEMIVQYRDVELSKQQNYHYKELIKEAVTTINETDVTAVNAAVLVSKLIQAACGVIYGENGAVLEMDFGPRLTAVKEIIDGCNEKVLVAIPFTGVLHAVKNKLQKDFSCEIIEGATSVHKRTEIINRFQQEVNPKVLLVNPAAISHGVTLTAASTTIWYAPTFRNEIYTQLNARMRRPGQTHKMNLVHLQSTSAERKAYKSLEKSGRIQQVVLDLIAENKK